MGPIVGMLAVVENVVVEVLALFRGTCFVRYTHLAIFRVFNGTPYSSRQSLQNSYKTKLSVHYDFQPSLNHLHLRTYLDFGAITREILDRVEVLLKMVLIKFKLCVGTK